MHKKIEAELIGLAHSILEMKNRENVHVLHTKATELCEKLSVLKFVDAYLNDFPKKTKLQDNIVNKEALVVLNEVKEEEQAVIDEVKKEEPISSVVDEEINKIDTPEKEEVEKIFGIEESFLKEGKSKTPSVQISLEEELKDAIDADVATQMFEKVTKKHPAVEEKVETRQRSLNDTLFKNNLQIGLNDRIAFVKNLFEGNQGDFNRVLSQLNSFKTENEAKKFLNNMVKPDYDWSKSEEYEQRLLKLIERKFV